MSYDYLGGYNKHNRELEETFHAYDEKFVELFFQTFNVQYAVDGYYQVFGSKDFPDGYQLQLNSYDEYDYHGHHEATEYQVTDGYGNIFKMTTPPWNNYFMIKHYNGRTPCVVYNMEPEQVIQKFNRFKKLRAFL